MSAARSSALGMVMHLSGRTLALAVTRLTVVVLSACTR